jgi:IS5 family transposase
MTGQSFRDAELAGWDHKACHWDDTLGAVPEGGLRTRIEERMALVTRLLRQTPRSAGKLYALHEAEVDCIAKGKARARYELGTKVSVATTLAGGFVVGMRSMPRQSL